MTHATRGRDGRQEGRERGYYHLHRNLNHSLLHNSEFLFNHELREFHSLDLGRLLPKGRKKSVPSVV